MYKTEQQKFEKLKLLFRDSSGSASSSRSLSDNDSHSLSISVRVPSRHNARLQKRRISDNLFKDVVRQLPIKKFEQVVRLKDRLDSLIRHLKQSARVSITASQTLQKLKYSQEQRWQALSFIYGQVRHQFKAQDQLKDFVVEERPSKAKKKTIQNRKVLVSARPKTAKKEQDFFGQARKEMNKVVAQHRRHRRRVNEACIQVLESKAEQKMEEFASRRKREYAELQQFLQKLSSIYKQGANQWRAAFDW